MRILYFLLLASLAASLSSQKEISMQEEIKTGSIISGRVLDASTNKPLNNVLLVETVENDTAAYYYTTTDEEGRFSFPLFGTRHVLKVIADTYMSVKIPLDKTTFDIKLEKDPDGCGKDEVMYVIGPINLSDMMPENIMNSKSGSDIRVIKQEELTSECHIEDGVINQ